MAFSWNLRSAISSRRRYRSWDISSVDVGWRATQWRLRTSGLGRFQIALQVFTSSWVLSAIIDGLYQICRYCNSHGGIDGERCPICLGSGLSDSFLHSLIWQLSTLAHPCTYSGFSDGFRQYILDTDASNFGLIGVLSQIQDDVECVVVYCSRALRYCTTKREMLAAVAMCIQFRLYLCGAKFTLRTDHKSLVWLHRFKDAEGTLAWWLHAPQQFQFSIVHRPGRDHGNADGLSRVHLSPCRQCTQPDCLPAIEVTGCADQPFDSESTGSSEDADIIPIHSGEDWIALLDDDLSQPSAVTGDSFRIHAL